MFTTGFLYIFASVVLFFETKKSDFINRIKRSYKIGYLEKINAVKVDFNKKQNFKLNLYDKMSSWLLKNGLNLEPWALIIAAFLILSFIFILCLFIKLGIFIFIASSLAIAFTFYTIVDLRGRKLNYKKEIQMESFLIDLMGNLFANPSIISGIQKSTEGAKDPLKKEFERVIEDTKKGARLNEALENFIKRNRSTAIQIVITGLIAANNRGVNLVEFLKDQIDYLREKRSIENYLKILSSGPRYTSYIIALIPIAVIIASSILNNDFTASLVRGAGLYVLVYAAVSYLAGFVIINKLVNLSDKTDKNIR